MLSPRRLVLMTACASIVALAGPAYAAPKKGQKPTGQSEAATRGQVLFEQSEAAYREGRYDDAITLLKEAYRYTPDPVVFYNLARAYQAKDDLKQALESYESYLAQAKDIPDRAEIESKVASIKATLQAREEQSRKPTEPAVVAPVAPPPPAGDDGSSPSPVPWIIAGVGGAGLIVGGVLGGLALGKNGEAEDAPSQAETVDLKSSADTLALVSTVSFAVGGAILAGGAIWGIIDVVGSGDPKADTALRLRIGPTSASMSLTF